MVSVQRRGQVARQKSHGLGLYSSINDMGRDFPRIENPRPLWRAGQKELPPPPLFFCRPSRRSDTGGGMAARKNLPVVASPRARDFGICPWSRMHDAMVGGQNGILNSHHRVGVGT
jgi:hypothetical protein